MAYYQQVGRAGRALQRSYGILLNGREDDDIQEYFIDSAFPPGNAMAEILDVLARSEGLTVREILSYVNISYRVMEKALKLLEIDGAVARDPEKRGRYFRTLNAWRPDLARMERITGQRRGELAQMQAYVAEQGCLMEFLTRALDDRTAAPCGHCANCRGRGLPAEVSPDLVAEAVDFLKRSNVVLEPRKQWPKGLFLDRKSTIPEDERAETGRALCYYGDAGWGKMVRDGKYIDGHFCDELVRVSAELIVERWCPGPFPEWVTAIPSRRRPDLVPDFARRLAAVLGIRYLLVLNRASDAPEQKTMANSTMQARNVKGTLVAADQVPPGPVLLVDDIVDSGWTLTMAGWLLRTHGSGVVYPFALARATARKA